MICEYLYGDFMLHANCFKVWIAYKIELSLIIIFTED